MNLLVITTVLICSNLFFPKTDAQCRQQLNCFMPKCFCSNKQFPRMRVEDIPQMVYFGFDDAVTTVVAKHYQRIFTPTRQNPNGCPIKMSLYISHNYTDYDLVREYYKQGHEIAIHSVNHVRVDSAAILYKEAKIQKETLAKLAGVQEKDMVGWRSPFLQTAGEDQPRILKQLGFKYDISLTYTRNNLKDDRMIWPFTLDYGWPHRCQIPDCPQKPHPGFWEVPVISLMGKDNKYSCAYVDGCYSPPLNEKDTYDYLWNNFKSYYEGSRAPLGFNMHAAWFQYPTYDRVKAVNDFLDTILQFQDVYVVTVKQVLEWMENPTPLSHISSLKSWSCDQSTNKVTQQNIPRATTYLNPSKSSNNQKVSAFSPTENTDADLSSKQNNRPNSLVSSPRQNTQQIFERSSVTNNLTASNKQLDIKNHLNHTHDMRGDQYTTLSPNLPQVYKTSIQTTATVRRHSRILEHNHDQLSTNTQSVLGCRQDINCFLPKCFCKTTDIPSVPVYHRPQLVLLNIDGPIQHSVYPKYETIFSNRVNPDRCPIRGTLFVSAKTNSSMVKRLHNMGLEISLQGVADTSYRSYQRMRLDIINQLHSLTSSPDSPQMSDIKGWRSPASKPVRDDQFKVLKSFGLIYDSSLISERSFIGKNGLFPFTLDYGWTEPCQKGYCPNNKHSGIWEIPVSTLRDIRYGHSCNYADDCPQPMLNAGETEEFLWSNFLRHYKSNRQPFSINLTQKWFHWNYYPNFQGLLNFIDRVLKLGNVYFVSNTDAIKWVQSPVKWSEIPIRC